MNSFLYMHLKEEGCFEYLLINTETITDIMVDEGADFIHILSGDARANFHKDSVLEAKTNNKCVEWFLKNAGVEVERVVGYLE